jgi:hypothetical protein
MATPQTKTPPQKAKPQEECLVCKAPMTSRPGATFNGKGGNGMLVRFWMCAECASELSTTPGAKLS